MLKTIPRNYSGDVGLLGEVEHRQVERQFNRGLKRLLLCRRNKMDSNGMLGSSLLFPNYAPQHPSINQARVQIRGLPTMETWL